MTYINITEFLEINWLEKDHSTIKTRCLKNVVVFIQTDQIILQVFFTLSEKKKTEKSFSQVCMFFGTACFDDCFYFMW